MQSLAYIHHIYLLTCYTNSIQIRKIVINACDLNMSFVCYLHWNGDSERLLLVWNSILE